jgi:hypothetical protein
MQGVLFLVFCGSVGLAQFVIHQHRINGNNRLTAARYVGTISIKLPKGWEVERENQGSVLLVAVEPDSTESDGRQLTIRRNDLDKWISPEEFLQTSGLLRNTEQVADQGTNLTEKLMVAGVPGVLLVQAKRMNSVRSEILLFAASVRPSGLAISLELDCPDDSDLQDDIQTLREVAGAMNLRDSETGK